MIDIKRNLHEVRERIKQAAERARRSPEEISIVAITKTFEVSDIQAAYKAGLNNFGENRVQEAESKIPEVTRIGFRPTWHMVGHLQSNKVKTALNFFDIIHSVDSINLAQTISRRAYRTVPILIEVNVAGEANKFGLSLEQVSSAVEEIDRLPNLDIRGLMTIAPLVHDPEEVRPIFRKLQELRDSMGLTDLSMGMTDDYEVAVEEGATIVRIGRAIFGTRG